MKDQIKILMFLVLVFLISLSAKSQSNISGIIKDEHNEPVSFATIAIISEGKVIDGTESDFDGAYSINVKNEGVLDIQYSFLGFETKRIGSLLFSHNSNLVLNVTLIENFIPNCSLAPIYDPPLVDFDFSSPGEVIKLDNYRE